MASARMTPVYRLPVSSLVDPLRQGEFDTFSGLYAVVNALRLIDIDGHRLAPMECRWLFERGIELLQADGHMTVALGWGIALSRWRRILHTLVDEAAGYLGRTIYIDRPFKPRSGAPREAVFAAIDKAMRVRSPALIVLAGVYEHYTVVSGCSAARLMLFDSANRRTLLRAGCGVHDGNTDGDLDSAYRHHILAGSLHILEPAP